MNFNLAGRDSSNIILETFQQSLLCTESLDRYQIEEETMLCTRGYYRV